MKLTKTTEITDATSGQAYRVTRLTLWIFGKWSKHDVDGRVIYNLVFRKLDILALFLMITTWIYIFMAVSPIVYAKVRLTIADNFCRSHFFDEARPGSVDGQYECTIYVFQKSNGRVLRMLTVNSKEAQDFELEAINAQEDKCRNPKPDVILKGDDGGARIQIDNNG